MQRYKKKHRIWERIFFCSFIFVVVVCSCADSVNPTAPFKPHIVIYSVLSSQTDTQYVRVYLSYPPTDRNPLNNNGEQPVNDARVVILAGNQTFLFRDTVITSRDLSRDAHGIHLYYAYPMRVESNKTYTLNVFSPTYGLASATTTVPDNGSISFSSVNVLEKPDEFPYQGIQANVVLSPRAGAFLYRLYLVFTAENPWEPETERNREKYFEVPILRVATDRNLDRCDIYYPRVLKNTTQAPRPGQDPLLLGVAFPFPTYSESIASIQRLHFNVRFKRAVLFLAQFDEPWYKYYANVNLFQDRLAVRIDQPADYTNISGGVGLFASIRIDSTVWKLPELIRPFDPLRYTSAITYCQQEVPQIAPKFADLLPRIP